MLGLSQEVPDPLVAFGVQLHHFELGEVEEEGDECVAALYLLALGEGRLYLSVSEEGSDPHE